MQDCEIKKKTSYSVEVVNITWCLLGGKNSDRPFLTLMEMECPYSLEEDSTGFQLCDWIPLTEKTPSTPSLQNQFLKGDHGVTVETLFYLLYSTMAITKSESRILYKSSRFPNH